MKKILLAVLAVALIAGPATAGSRILATRTTNYYTPGGVQDSNVVVKSSSGLIYSLELVAVAANATMTIFDQSSGPSSGNAIYEVSVATANDSKSVDLSAAPLNMDKGILVTVTNGSGYLTFE